MVIDASKAYLVEARLLPVLRQRGLDDFEGIVDKRIGIGVGDFGDLLGVNRTGVHGLGEGVEGGFELLLVFAG